MKSQILRTIIRVVQPVFLLLAVFLFIRGHNSPGGGFVAGLVAAAAPMLEALVVGADSARRAVRVTPEFMVGTGLLTLIASGLIGVFGGKPFLTGVWHKLELPLIGQLELGTPLLFDFGVFLAVFGVALTIAFSLMEVQ